jgi:hypothetical protein
MTAHRLISSPASVGTDAVAPLGQLEWLWVWTSLFPLKIWFFAAFLSAYCHVGSRQVGNGSPPATKEGVVQGSRHRRIILRT